MTPALLFLGWFAILAGVAVIGIVIALKIPGSLRLVCESLRNDLPAVQS